MCFSAEADLVGGLVLSVVGLDAVRHVRQRHDHLALATLPFLLAAHQVDEAFVWWGLQGHVSEQAGRIATWVYLLFAFVVLPVYIPLAVRSLEPPGGRRVIMTGFAAGGAAVSGVLLVSMLHGPVTATLGHHHIAYGIGEPAALLITGVYVAATCGAMLFSGYRILAGFGVVNLVAVAVLAKIQLDGFASLWCGWAAVTAVVIALHLRQAGGSRSVAAVLA